MNGFAVCSIISLLIYLIQYNWTFLFLFTCVFSCYLLLERLLVPSHALKINNLRRKLAVASWGDPDSPECHGHGHIKVSQAYNYLSRFKSKTGLDLTLAQLLCKAACDSLSQFQDMNGRIAFGSFIPNERNKVTLIKSVDSGQNLLHTSIPECNLKTLLEVAQLCAKPENSVKAFVQDSYAIPEKLASVFRYCPSGISGVLLETLSFVVNSVGIDVPQLGLAGLPFGSLVIYDLQDSLHSVVYPVLMPFMRSSFFCSISAVKSVPAVVNGEIVVEEVITLAFTGDHRYGDGTRALKAMQGFKQRMEDPDTFYPID